MQSDWRDADSVVMPEHRLEALEEQRAAGDPGRGHRCGPQEAAATRQSVPGAGGAAEPGWGE